MRQGKSVDFAVQRPVPLLTQGHRTQDTRTHGGRARVEPTLPGLRCPGLSGQRSVSSTSLRFLVGVRVPVPRALA